MRVIKILLYSEIITLVLLFSLIVSSKRDDRTYIRHQSFTLEIPENLNEQYKPVLVGQTKTVSSENDWDRYIDSITMNVGAREWLKRVWRCESSGNALAKNPTSPASGLMQFFPSTYKAYGGKDLWSGEEQLRVALIMYEIGQQKQWVCK